MDALLEGQGSVDLEPVVNGHTHRATVVMRGGLQGHERNNTDVICLNRGARVRVQLHGVAPRILYFDKVFELADDEVLLLIAIDRTLRLPGNPSTIVEHSILRP